MRLRKPYSKFYVLSWLFVIAAAAVFVVGVALTTYQHLSSHTKQHSPARNIYDIATTNTAPPSTKKPEKSEFDSYQVAPDAPRYIFVPKLSIKAMVRPVNITADNRIQAPANVFDAGWYRESAKPGQPGAMFIDGHLSSWETPGVFYELKKLKSGDEIVVERGDGVKITYAVVESRTYDTDKVDMNAALAPIDSDRPGLNIMTCAGNVIKGTNDFDKRLVVFAEQL